MGDLYFSFIYLIKEYPTMGPELSYTCRKHAGVRRSRAGRCPQCDRTLVTETPGDALVRQLNPAHLALMGVTLLAAVAVAMLFAR